MMNPIRYLFPTVLLSLLLTACAKNSQPVTRSGFYFDTFVSITVYDGQDAKRLLTDCFALCEDYDRMFSISDVNSDIYRLNHANGAPVPVSEETMRLITESLRYAQFTDGLLDPTVQSVYELWDFTPDQSALPDPSSIAAALSCVDYRNVIPNEADGNVQLLNGAQLNLGAFAKGYIADRLKDYLLANNVSSAMINLGGNIQLIGNKNGENYRIGIQKPFDQNGAVLTTVSVSDCSVVTSGKYQRCFRIGNQIYHHLLDPATGYPKESDLDSATVICAQSLDADAYSTLLLLLGKEGAMNFLNEHPDLSAVLVTDQGEILRFNI